MFRALVLHNSVLRAAKYHNGGFVMEQEGDSFTVAFYDPFDAVVFCLQVRCLRAFPRLKSIRALRAATLFKSVDSSLTHFLSHRPLLLLLSWGAVVHTQHRLSRLC